MVNRILLNVNGLEVSKPGVDVFSATPFQKLFSSSFKSPLLISKGSFVSTPGGGNGTSEVVTDIWYGATLSPPPFVVAIAQADHWILAYGNKAQYGFLNGQWHTFIVEYPSFAPTNVYDGVVRVRGGSGNPNQTPIPVSFASARFIANVFSDHVSFHINCRTNCIVKYAILRT